MIRFYCMDHPKPRTPRETNLEALFAEFVALGEQRSYGKIARKHGIEAPELMRHARQFLWPERIHSLQLVANEQTSTATDPNEAGANEINRLHLTRLKLLQQKAMQYLENVVFDKPDTALKMLIESMKLEREIKGLTKDKTEDLRAILERRIREATDLKPAAPAAPEFQFDPELPIDELPDGPEANPAPPSGGDHVERLEDPIQ